MSAPRTSSSLQRLAQGAVAVAVVVFGWSVVSAIRLTPTPPLDADRAQRRAAVATTASLTADALERAVSHDMFSPSREAPSRAYSLVAPTEAERPGVEDEAPVDDVPPELPTVQGTAVDASGDGFAMCAAPGGPVVVVRPGDVIGAFTVVSIERTRVVFRDALGRRHTVAAVGSPSGDES